MRLPVPPSDSTRTFARVEAAWLSCPRCGQVLYFSPTKRLNCTWNPRTARLKCEGCRLTFAIGLMIWPVAAGAGGAPTTIPVDQVPYEGELAQLRAMEGIGQGSGAGWWMLKAEPRKSWREVHTNVGPKCSCRPSDGPLGDVGCPLHGVETYEGSDPWPR
jgi:hypothetical protein